MIFCAELVFFVQKRLFVQSPDFTTQICQPHIIQYLLDVHNPLLITKAEQLRFMPNRAFESSIDLTISNSR